MARHLDIPVIAEGIEGWQQLEKLRELGCQTAQGYLFSKAVPAFACRRYLRDGHIQIGRPGSSAADSSGSYPDLAAELLAEVI